jgi:acetylxylan esterase
MVDYAVINYNANASRVAITGSSSGGNMVSLLAGIYPEKFQAASIFSGEYTDKIEQFDGVRTKMMM